MNNKDLSERLYYFEIHHPSSPVRRILVIKTKVKSFADVNNEIREKIESKLGIKDEFIIETTERDLIDEADLWDMFSTQHNLFRIEFPKVSNAINNKNKRKKNIDEEMNEMIAKMKQSMMNFSNNDKKIDNLNPNASNNTDNNNDNKNNNVDDLLNENSDSVNSNSNESDISSDDSDISVNSDIGGPGANNDDSTFEQKEELRIAESVASSLESNRSLEQKLVQCKKDDPNENKFYVVQEITDFEVRAIDYNGQSYPFSFGEVKFVSNKYRKFLSENQQNLLDEKLGILNSDDELVDESVDGEDDGEASLYSNDFIDID